METFRGSETLRFTASKTSLKKESHTSPVVCANVALLCTSRLFISFLGSFSGRANFRNGIKSGIRNIREE